MRCGQLGHVTENCTSEIPSNEKLRQQMLDLENESLQFRTEEWKEDDMGLYLPVKERVVGTDKSWSDGVFCFNCGEFGHTAEHCTEPTFETIDRMFSPYIGDKSDKGIEKKQQIIDAINKYHETHQED